MSWLARNSRALDPERINLSKSARTSIGRFSRKPPQVESHQSSHEATSHTPESIVSMKDTWEADNETDRFFTSLAFSKVIEKGQSTVPEKRKRRYGSTDDVSHWARARNRAQSGPPKIWTEPNYCRPEVTAARER